MAKTIGIAEFTEENEREWNMLSAREKICVRYMIKNDVTMSSVLVGVFSAYVVNLFSNLVSMSFGSILHGIMYAVNAAAAVGILAIIIHLYSVHIKVEYNVPREGSGYDALLNRRFEFLFDNYQKKCRKWTAELCLSVLILVMTLAGCLFANHYDHSDANEIQMRMEDENKNEN